MHELRNYSLVTVVYWSFTLTDGALRMLVLLHFHGLGYSPIQLAFLFLFYEFFGIVTNLVGGWVGSRQQPIADPDDHRVGNRDHAHLSGVEGQTQRPRGARAAAECLADRLRF